MADISNSLDASIHYRSEWNQKCALPFTINKDPHSLLRREITISVGNIEFKGYEIQMPDKSSSSLHSETKAKAFDSLIWCAWPDNVVKPCVDFNTDYQQIKVFNKDVIQPRKTLCYGVSYHYSGTTHKLEESIPDSISTLLDLTKRMYKTNLNPICLANAYTTCHHCIHAHSDDEKQMDRIKDVICFVTGATRRLVLTNNSKPRSIVLDVSLPEGLYIMRGSTFQKNYKHEIPREYESAFKHFCSVIPHNEETEDDDEVKDNKVKDDESEDEVKDTPKKKEMTALQKADYLHLHADEVMSKLDDIKVRGNKDLKVIFKEWNQCRVSYTIRFFKA